MGFIYFWSPSPGTALRVEQIAALRERILAGVQSAAGFRTDTAATLSAIRQSLTLEQSAEGREICTVAATLNVGADYFARSPVSWKKNGKENHLARNLRLRKIMAGDVMDPE